MIYSELRDFLSQGRNDRAGDKNGHQPAAATNGSVWMSEALALANCHLLEGYCRLEEGFYEVAQARRSG